MGREVRRVSKDWEHPKNHNGFCPLFDGFSTALTDWKKNREQWDNGFVESFKDYPKEAWRPKGKSEEGSSFKEWYGEKPSKEDYMPEWTEEEKTRIQMYETCSEGTPISPVMETPEELARWLVDNNASAFGGEGASYEAWLRVCLGGDAPSAVMMDGKLTSGVEAGHCE